MVELLCSPTQVLKHRNPAVVVYVAPSAAGKLVVVTSTKIASGALDPSVALASLPIDKAWATLFTTNTRVQEKEDLAIAKPAYLLEVALEQIDYVNANVDYSIKMVPVALVNMVTNAHQILPV